MKKFRIYLMSVVICLQASVISSCSDDDKGSGGDVTSALAFPGAEGCGKNATGGRGGTVYRVTSLGDVTTEGTTEAGTLRWALSQPAPRIIIFTVSGTIKLKFPLSIPSNTTIFGQSAPGDGICVSGENLDGGKDHLMNISGDNVIVQFMRFRLGNKDIDADAFNCIGRNNIMIDHCSFSWSTDECITCYKNTNLTLQWCMVYEGLNTDMKGNHGFGGIWGGQNVTFHHNLIANESNRNPRFDHQYAGGAMYGPIDFENNVVYFTSNCNGVYGGESCNTTGDYRKINVVNNYYKCNSDASSMYNRILQPTTSCGNCTDKCSGYLIPGKFYVVGNYMDGSVEATTDNWNAVSVSSSFLDKVKATAKFSPVIEYTAESATEAYDNVLAKAGASYVRDEADNRVITQVKDNTGKPVADVPGWPTLNTGTKAVDSDYDGIPDEWEDAHGLDKKSYSDSKKMSSAGYMYIEEYMHELVKHLY